jgi:hypothetical protein
MHDCEKIIIRPELWDNVIGIGLAENTESGIVIDKIP